MNKVFFLLGLCIPHDIDCSNYKNEPIEYIMSENIEGISNNSTNSNSCKNLKIIMVTLSFVTIALGLVNYLYEYSGLIPNPDCILNPAGEPINCCVLEIQSPGFCSGLPLPYSTMPLNIQGIIENQKSITGFILECVVGAINILSVVLVSSGNNKSIPMWIKQSLVAFTDIILGILIIIGESVASQSTIRELSGNNVESVIGEIIGSFLLILGGLMMGLIFSENKNFKI